MIAQHRMLRFLSAAGCIPLASACSGPAHTDGSVADTPQVDTSLSSLMDKEPGQRAGALPTPEDFVEAATRDLDSILAAQAALPRASIVHTPVEQSVPADGSWSELLPDLGGVLRRRFSAFHDGFFTPAWVQLQAELARHARTPGERMAIHARQIAEIARAYADDADPNMLMTLAALECVRPGILYETIDPVTLELMPPEERAAIEAVQRIVREGEEPLAKRVLEGADLVREAKPMTIGIAVLARAVSGFGSYELLGTSSFVAGQPRRMIVYTEIDNFAHRPASQADGGSPGERWAVELSQELRLFRDGVYVWGRPESTIIETSRNKRRDFYLVHEIELPPTLAVGPYELKIIMRDKTSGETDEWIIPFRYVATPAAAQAN